MVAKKIGKAGGQAQELRQREACQNLLQGSRLKGGDADEFNEVRRLALPRFVAFLVPASPALFQFVACQWRLRLSVQHSPCPGWTWHWRRRGLLAGFAGEPRCHGKISGARGSEASGSSIKVRSGLCVFFVFVERRNSHRPWGACLGEKATRKSKNVCSTFACSLQLSGLLCLWPLPAGL